MRKGLSRRALMATGAGVFVAAKVSAPAFASIKRRTLGCSRGFEGMSDNIPNRHVMMLPTICGHGLVSPVVAAKAVDPVKGDRVTPDEEVVAMCQSCSCGIFNPTRAKRIMDEARSKTF